MGGIIGVKRPAKRAADAAVAMQGQLQVALNDMKAQIAEARHEIVTKLIPQVNRTLDAAIDSMQAVVVSVKNVEEKVSKTIEKVDDTVLTAKFSLEIIMIILFLLIVPRLFEEKRRDIVFGIPSFRLSVLPSFRPPNIVGTLCAQLLLQFYADSFETLQMFLSWSEDMHVVWILS